MVDFPFIPANKQSIAGRKLIFGVGLNDANYQVKPEVDGKRLCCPFYKTWKSMLCRCYYHDYQSKYKTYEGCYVDEAWLTFSSFRKWMARQEWEGRHLDKDLLVPGNKVYGPRTCVFIPPRVNLFMTDAAAIRGRYPVGVCELQGRFQSRVHDGTGKRRWLGSFATPEEAAAEWARAKKEIAYSLADSQDDERIKFALIRFGDSLQLQLN